MVLIYLKNILSHVEYQIDLIKKYWGDWIPPKDKNELFLFRQPEYKKCINECVEIVREKWITICKNEEI